MSEGISAFVIPAKDLAASKALYTALLGAEPESDAPYYVGWKVGGVDVGLDPNGHAQGMTGPVAYWEVDDIETSITALVDAGGQLQRESRDVGGGKLIATVTDADGNVIGLSQTPAG